MRAHSHSSHLQTQAKSTTQIKPCCDVSLGVYTVRYNQLNGILQKFQLLNQNITSELPKQNIEVPKKVAQNVKKKREPTHKTEELNQQQEIIDNEFLDDYVQEDKKEKNQPKTIKLTLKEKFLTNHNFENLSNNQKNILWKLQQLIVKSDKLSTLCSQVSHLIYDESNQQNDILQGTQVFTLNQTMRNINELMETGNIIDEKQEESSKNQQYSKLIKRFQTRNFQLETGQKRKTINYFK